MIRLLLTFVLAAACWGAEADALRIEEKIRARHLPYSNIIDPVYATPESDQIVSYSRCGDAAVWTGHYLAAESYRYAVTRSPEALEQVRVALTGVTLLFLVSGTDVPARCAFRPDFPAAADMKSEERPNNPYEREFFGEPWALVSNTSRDQYLGLYFGMTAAWELVDDPSVRDTIRWLVGLSLQKLVDMGWVLRTNEGGSGTTFFGRADQVLMMLKLGARVDPERWEALYRETAAESAGSVILPIAFDTLDPHGSYFKFNLDHIAFYGLLASGENPANWNTQYRSAWSLLRRTTDDHGNAFFDVIARAVEGPNEERDARIARLLNEWLERPERNAWVDLRGQVRECGVERACDPIPVKLRVTTDFLWQRSPFQMVGGGFGTIEGAGIDYILPYWMARYYGVLSE